MRVLFLNHNVVDSGTFFRAFFFGRQLAARGHQVTLVTTSRNARLAARTYERDGIELIEAPDLMPGRARTGWDPFNTQMRRLIVRRRAYDIVHAFDSRPAVIYPALAAVAHSNALFVMDWADWWGRGGWIEDRSGWLVRTLFGPVETWFEEAYRTRAAGMTVISRALAERSSSLGIAEHRIRRIAQGCNAEGRRLLTRAAARAQLGINAAAPLIVHVGVLTPGDYDLLRRAFVIVRRSHANALLAIVGRTGMRVPADSSPQIVTGAITEETLAAWLAAANACVIPCRDTIGNRGRWPSKINDYLSAGRAVVMPRVSDAAELIVRRECGWVTMPDAHSFGEGMVAALSDNAVADAAGERARATARSELSWEVLGEELVGFYRSLGASL